MSIDLNAPLGVDRNSYVQSKSAPIAIVGMSCRFPEANNLKEFWRLLTEGKDTVSEIPNDRWDHSMYYDPDPTVSGKTNQRHGAFLKDINHFDPFFFKVSPTEAIHMSPSQKLMLELAWEAIQESNIPSSNVNGKKVGVYVGNIWSDFEHERKAKASEVTLHSAVGQSSNVIANRISYAFGFTGPSLVVDTGCSSSLVALHLACQSIWDGSSEMAIAGGVNHLLDPDQYVYLTKFGGLSSNGKCSTFDANGDGFVRGEGGGLLMLKRLDEAEKDGDKVLAVIKGSAVNNNGFNVNLPATSVKGQVDLLEEAYRSAGIQPNEVHFVEAHGTGTKLGDPTETNAIGSFFNKERKQKLRLGSVKTNIGHLEGAAGIAGVIKTVLAIQHKTLPKNINFKTPNPKIDFEGHQLKVQDENGEWPTVNGETLKAGVNSFGWGGTNAHTVLEEYKPSTPIKKEHSDKKRLIIPLSAHSSASLKEAAKEYFILLKERVNGSRVHLSNICQATALKDNGFEYRETFSGEDKEELIFKLNYFANDKEEAEPVVLSKEKPKVAFVFPGQGSQWLGMGKDLYEKEPAFKKAIDECEKAYAKHTDWSLIDQLFADKENSRLKEINVIQPMICAMQIALAKLWQEWGVTPDAVVGHSMGEVAAAHISGAITLESAANIICTRSKLMKTVSGQGGAMAVTELTLDEANELIKEYPKLSIAVSNSPKSTVLAGDEQQIVKVVDMLDEKDLFARQVKVDVASHSPQMDPLKADLKKSLSRMKPKDNPIPIYSTVKNKKMDGKEMGADYWVDNLRGMVQFSSVCQQMFDDGHTVFIEVSPHPVLTNAIQGCADKAEVEVSVSPSLYREKPELEIMGQSLEALYTQGFPVAWESYYGSSQVPHVDLPLYSLNREEYAIDDNSAKVSLNTQGGHPLLGKAVELAGMENLFYWNSTIEKVQLSFLKGFEVNGKSVLPTSSVLAMLGEAATELYGKGAFSIQDIRNRKAVEFTEEGNVEIQLRIEKLASGLATFQLFFKNEGKWEVAADGCMRQEEAEEELVEPLDLMTFDMLTSRGRLSTEEMYNQVENHTGVSYGEPMQTTEAAWMSNRRMVIKLKTPAMGKFLVHPSTLEGAFNTLYARAASDGIKGELLSVGQFQLLRDIPEVENSWLIATFQKSETEERSSLKASFVFYAPDGHAYATISGMRYVSGKPAAKKVAVKEVVTQPVKKKKPVEVSSQASNSEIGDLQDHIIKQISKITKAPVSRIKPTMTFKSLGVDSLMAVQLKNLLAKTLPVKITVSAFWAHPTIKEYTTFLKGMMKESKPAAAPKAVVSNTAKQTSLDKMEGMSLDDLASELDEELKDLI